MKVRRLENGEEISKPGWGMWTAESREKKAGTLEGLEAGKMGRSNPIQLN